MILIFKLDMMEWLNSHGVPTSPDFERALKPYLKRTRPEIFDIAFRIGKLDVARDIAKRLRIRDWSPERLAKLLILSAPEEVAERMQRRTTPANAHEVRSHL